jgi:hypothetical protein
LLNVVHAIKSFSLGCFGFALLAGGSAGAEVCALKARYSFSACLL